VEECNAVRQMSGYYPSLVPLKFGWLLKRYKFSGTHQLIQEGRAVRPEVRGIWKDCLNSGRCRLQIVYLFRWQVRKLTSSYQGILLFSTTCKILSNIIPSRVTPYVEEINCDRQCGFCHNVKYWGVSSMFGKTGIQHNGAMHQQFIHQANWGCIWEVSGSMLRWNTSWPD
jgi:hypothetical protein